MTLEAKVMMLFIDFHTSAMASTRGLLMTSFSRSTSIGDVFHRISGVPSERPARARATSLRRSRRAPVRASRGGQFTRRLCPAANEARLPCSGAFSTLVAAHRDHRYSTSPRQASRKPRGVTSQSVRPVTFLSVIYNKTSHSVVFWKIQRRRCSTAIN
jgi:hypothetical protein